MNNDKDYRRLPESFEDIFGKVDSDISDETIENAYLRLQSRIHGKKRRSLPLLWAGGVAASILLIAAGAFGSSVLNDEKPVETVWNEIHVPVGQMESLTLEDGTILHINACSRVTYPDRFTSGERKIFVDGEVYAEVTSNPSRPFVIESDNISVRVFGTKFDFKSYPDSRKVELVLVEGKVRLEVKGEGESAHSVDMSPGMIASYDRESGQVELKDVDLLTCKPFNERNGHHFYNIPLQDIVSELERTFGCRIIITDSKAADAKYFAVFSNGEGPEEILRALGNGSFGSPVKLLVRSKGDTIYVSSK